VKGIFVPKPDDSYEMANAFRPITLTYIFSKMTGKDIRTGPLQRLLLHESKHAYQRGKPYEIAPRRGVEPQDFCFWYVCRH
jgi:hypothetical protein